MTGQLLTNSNGEGSEKSLSEQAASIVSACARLAGLHNYVKHGDANTGAADQPENTQEAAEAPREGQRRPSNRKLSSKRRPRRTKASKAGGWPVTSYIDHETFKRFRGGAGVLAREGYPLNVLVTVRPPSGAADDGTAKRHIDLQFARLGQALERRGHAFIGFKAFEKKNGRLHGHMPLHVARECLHVVERWADRFDRKPKRACEILEGVNKHARLADHDNAMLYALKQHQFAGPFEPRRKFYEKGEPFRGRRAAFTPTADAIIQAAEQPPVQQAVAPVRYVEPVQLGLPLAAPVVDIRALVESKRREIGLSQQELAGRHFGMKQAGYSNAFVRRHDRPSPWVISRALEFIGSRIAA